MSEIADAIEATIIDLELVKVHSTITERELEIIDTLHKKTRASCRERQRGPLPTRRDVMCHVRHERVCTDNAHAACGLTHTYVDE